MVQVICDGKKNGKQTTTFGWVQFLPNNYVTDIKKKIKDT